MSTTKNKEECLAIVTDLEQFIEDLIKHYEYEQNHTDGITPKVFELKAKLECLGEIKDRMQNHNNNNSQPST